MLLLQQFNAKVVQKSFFTNEDIKKHMIVHNLERPESCMKCLKVFKTIPALKGHQRTHDMDRNYACNIILGEW